MDGFDGRSHNERYVKPHQQVQLHLWHTLQLATGNLQLAATMVAKKSQRDFASFVASANVGNRKSKSVGEVGQGEVLGSLGAAASARALNISRIYFIMQL